MKIIISVVLGLFLSSGITAQNAEADRIIGTWIAGGGKGRIQITRYGENKYGGKLVWMREPNEPDGTPKLDKKNPDVNKRTQPKLGLNNLLGFVYDGDNEYTGGTIYDPETGKTYKCVMELVDENTLKVRGYIGITMIGRSDTWTRMK